MVFNNVGIQIKNWEILGKKTYTSPSKCRQKKPHLGWENVAIWRTFFFFLQFFLFFCREQIIYWIWLTEFIRITRTVGGCSVSWEPTDFKEVKSVRKKDLIFKINFIEINKTTLDYIYSWILNEDFCWNTFILILKSIKYNIRIWIEMSYYFEF